MKRAWVLAACVVLAAAACQPLRDGAIRVVIDVAAAEHADCVELDVLAGGAVLASQLMPRPPGKSSFQVAVKQGDLPATVQYQAVGWVGTCADAGHKLNGRSPAVEHAFPKSGLEEVRLTLDAPDPSLDADRDGYVGAAFGGPDCDDANADAHPGATQVCNSAVDLDCNGHVGCDDPACSQDPLCLRPPSSLALNPASLSVGAGDCSGPLAVETRDLTSLAPVGVPTTVTLTGSGVPLELFTTACTGAPVASVTIPIGQATATVFVRGARAGSATLTAAAPLLTPATATVTIGVQPVAALVFATPPQTVVAGGCTGEVALEVRDGQGRPTQVTAPVPIALSASPPLGVTFHDPSDGTCATPLAPPRLLLGPGAGSASFRVRSTFVDVGPTTLTAAVTAPALTATQPLSVAARPPSKLAFTSAQQGLQVNVCSPLPVTLQLQDQYGNAAVSTAPEVVSLDSTPAGITWFSAPGCTTPGITAVTIPPGQTTASVYLSGSPRGSYTLGAGWNGTHVTQPATIAMGPPDRLRIVSATVDAAAGVCSPLPVRVQTQDSSNAPSSVTGAALAVTVTLNPAAAVQLFTNSTCSAALVGPLQIPVGSTEGVLYFKSTTASTFNLAVSATGFQPDNQNQTVRPAAATVLHWRGSPPPPTVSLGAGQCSGPLTLDIQDAFGNATSFGAAATLTLGSTPSGVVFSTSPSCGSPSPTVAVGAAATSVTFYLQANLAQTYAVSGATATASTNGAASVVVSPLAADRLVFNPAPPATLTAGACQALTVERRDQFGNASGAAGGSTVTLSDSVAPAAFGFFTDGTCGTPTATLALGPNVASGTVYMRGTVAGPVTVTAQTGGLTSATAALSVGAATTAALTFSGLPASALTAGVCSGAVTVQRQDAFGNPTSPAGALPVQLQATGPSAATLLFYPTGNCTGTGLAPGTASIATLTSSATFSFKSQTAGTGTALAGTSGTLTPATGTMSVVAAAVAKLAFTTAAGSVAAGACSGPVTVESRDAFDNPSRPVAGLLLTMGTDSLGPLSFFPSPDCTGLAGTFPYAIPSTATSVTLSFKPTRAPESPHVTAAAGGLPTISQLWTVTVGPPAKLGWKALAASLTRYVCSATAAIVEVQDLGGNASVVAAPLTVTLAPNSAGTGLAWYAAAGCGGADLAAVTVPAGASEISFYPVAFGGGITTITASATGVASATSSSLTINGLQGSLGLASLSSVEAGACESVTVTRRDSALAPVTLGSSTLTLTASDPSITLHSDAQCGTALGAVTIAPGSSSATVYARGHSGAPTTSTVNASAANYANAVALPLSALPLVRRGTCTILNNQTSTSGCTVAGIPGNDISRTFLVFQASAGMSSGPTPAEEDVECHLVGGTSVTVACNRSFANGGSPVVSIVWQTVSWGVASGVTVQHLTGALPAASPANPLPLTLASAVTPGQTFLLVSHTGSGADSLSNQWITASLTDASTVSLADSASAFPTMAYSVEVVSLPGATVTRGLATGGAVDTVAVSGLAAADLTRALVLHTARLTSGTAQDTTEICKRRFRGLPDSATTLAFTRGAAAGGVCADLAVAELSWERVELPAGTLVQTVDAPIGTGSTSSGNLPFATGVVGHRTVVLASGQGPGGQAGGETTYFTNDDLGIPNASFTLTPPTQVSADRARNPSNVSRFAPFVVQFTP